MGPQQNPAGSRIDVPPAMIMHGASASKAEAGTIAHTLPARNLPGTTRASLSALKLRRLHLAAAVGSRMDAPRSDSSMCSATVRAAAATSGESSSPGVSRFASTA